MLKSRNSLIVALTLILIAGGSRLLPHWHNFTAVGATGLFAAFYFRKQVWAFLIPLSAMWLSDLVLNNLVYAAYNDGFVWFNERMIFVYLGFAGLVASGQFLIDRFHRGKILLASLVGSIVFFLLTNFGSFIQNPIYPKSGEGLMMAYTAGLPFFWNTLLGNVFYTVLIFAVYFWVASRKLLYKSTF